MCLKHSRPVQGCLCCACVCDYNSGGLVTEGISKAAAVCSYLISVKCCGLSILPPKWILNACFNNCQLIMLLINFQFLLDSKSIREEVFTCDTCVCVCEWHAAMYGYSTRLCVSGQHTLSNHLGTFYYIHAEKATETSHMFHIIRKKGCRWKRVCVS